MPQDLTARQIRDRLANYLVGRLSLKEFRAWFVPAAWDVEHWGTPGVTDLVHGISLRLAEYTSGHWSKRELNTQLLPFVTNITLERQGAKPPAERYGFQKLAATFTLKQVNPGTTRAYQTVGVRGASSTKLAVACG